MALSVSQKVVLAREDIYGVTNTSSPPEKAIPVETANVNLMTDPFLDQAKRGAASLDGEVYETVKHAEGTIEGPFFADEAAYFIMALMGDEEAVTTGATTADPSTHSFVAKTDFSNPQANSLTIDIIDDAQDFAYQGCYVSALTMRFSAAEGILTYSASIFGSTQLLAQELNNPAFAEVPALFGWTGQVKRSTGAGSKTADDQNAIWAGGQVVTALIDAEFTFNRPTAPTYTARNNQNLFRADPGPLEVTARFTMDFDSTQVPTAAQLATEYRDNTRKGWIFHLTNNASGALFEDREILIYIPIAAIIDQPLEVDRSETAIRLNLGVRAIHNSAMTGPHASATGGPVRFRVTCKSDIGIPEPKYAA